MHRCIVRKIRTSFLPGIAPDRFVQPNLQDFEHHLQSDFPKYTLRLLSIPKTTFDVDGAPELCVALAINRLCSVSPTTSVALAVTILCCSVRMLLELHKQPEAKLPTEEYFPTRLITVTELPSDTLNVIDLD